MITESEYIKAKATAIAYEFQQFITPGTLPTERQVAAWSDSKMKKFSCSPKLYHKKGALGLLKILKGECDLS